MTLKAQRGTRRLDAQIDGLTQLNHGQFLELEYLRPIAEAAKALSDEAEEYDFPDGMGQGAPQQYWDALNSALNPSGLPAQTFYSDMQNSVGSELDALLAQATDDEDAASAVTINAKQAAVLREAMRLADDSARSDVECFSRRIEMADGSMYYDPRFENPEMRVSDPEDREMAARAVAYLKARNKINPHPTDANLVNFDGIEP